VERVGRSAQRHEYATAGRLEPLHPRLVGVLPTGRGAEAHPRTGKMGSTAYPQMLLVERARPERAVAKPASVGAYGHRVGRGDKSSWRLAGGRPAGIAPGAKQRYSPQARLSISIGACREVKAAGSNRRMRKTACPVVWEGAGAQSPALDPIRTILHFTSALNNSLYVPCIWARCCAGNPISTTRPWPSLADTTAARRARFSSPTSHPLSSNSRSS
jgi:hypothetical protein